MKLISCKIDGFGCIVDKTFQFDDKLNCICEDNGSGKSTLAAFIRVMFYGFEGERNKKLVDREREKYRPWGCRFYGGRIRFEVNGRQYDMYRTFRDKPANDEFKLRDAVTNLESKDYPSEIGRSLFGIDSDSFMRCAFITQNHCETGATDDINSKIGNLSDDTSDLNNYESIMDRLNSIINGMTPNRKTGSLNRLEDEITGLKKAINDERTLEEQISRVMTSRESELRLLSDMRELRKKTAELYSRVAATADRDHYEDVCNTVNAAKHNYESAVSEFAFGIPEDEELTAAAGAYSSYANKSAEAENKALNNDELVRLKKLLRVFGNGFSAEECRGYTGKTQRLDYLRNVIDARQMTKEETARLSELSAFFGHRADPAEESIGIRSKWNEAGRKLDILSGKKKQLREIEEQKAALSVKQGPNKGMIAFGVVLVVIGMVCLFLQKMVPGSIAAGIGAVIGILSFVLKPRPPYEEIERIEKEAGRLERDIEQISSEIERTERETAAYLAGYGYPGNAEVMECFSEIYERALDYKQLRKKADESGCEEEKAEIRIITADIGAYLRSYEVEPEASLYDSLEELKEKYSEYTGLNARYDELKKLNDQAAENRQIFEAFLRKYGIAVSGADAETIARIRDKKVSISETKRAYDLACSKKTAFEAEHDIAKIIALVPIENMPTLKELTEKIDRVDEQIDLKKAEIDGITKELDSLMSRADDKKENQLLLDEKQEERTAGKKKYDMLMKMREHLEAAKQSLTAKYSNSIHKRFAYYMELLLGDASAYQLDADSNVSFEASGMPRSTRSLSAGYQDLVGLCLRLAFVDAMFADEKPFLILDDPLVNLDKQKTEAGMCLLKEVSEQYQTIYFTCHESRM